MRIQLYSFCYRLLLLLTNKYSNKSLRKIKFTVGSSLLLASNTINVQAQEPISLIEVSEAEDEPVILIPIPVIEEEEPPVYCYQPSIILSHLPEFPGGEENLQKFLAQHLSYPPNCPEIEGKVIVEFIVEKDGKITTPRVIRPLHPMLDAKAVQVVQKMPLWKPGTQRAKPVPVSYVLPIEFKISER